MKSNGLRAVLVLVVVVLLAPGSAVGETPVLAADCTQDAGCWTLKEQAAERSKNGDLVEALRLYKLAYAVRPDPRLLFSIARLLHKQGKLAEAVPYYQKFIDAPIQDKEQRAQREKAREYLAQIPEASRSATPAQKQNQTAWNPTENILSAEVARADAQPSGKPVYKKWWFWVAVGGAAVAVSAITVGVVLGKRSAAANRNRLSFEF